MNNNKYKVLVVEDDRSICSFLDTVLGNAGYQVLTAQTCERGLLMFSSHIPDLVVLDLGLPDKDGEEFIRQVRKEYSVPIIVLSARTDEKDKVSALDLGANDYISKPFGTREFLARIRAALRSIRGHDAMTYDGKFKLNDMTIDYNRRLVTMGNEIVRLTQTEYNILALLAGHTGKVMTYATIIREIWGERVDSGSIKKLQVNLANIRKKLGTRPGDNRYIINELGVGYRMQDEIS